MSTTAMNIRGLPARARSYLKGRAVKLAITAGALAPAALSYSASAFEICTTDIDQSFDVLTEHIIPNMAELVGSLPGLIVPIVILVVVILVLFFFPKLLNQLLEVLEKAVMGRMGKG